MKRFLVGIFICFIVFAGSVSVFADPIAVPSNCSIMRVIETGNNMLNVKDLKALSPKL